MKEEKKGEIENNNQKVDEQHAAFKKERQVLLIVNDSEVCKKLESSINEICGFETQTSEEGKKAL